jgi:hypothetical protein
VCVRVMEIVCVCVCLCRMPCYQQLRETSREKEKGQLKLQERTAKALETGEQSQMSFETIGISQQDFPFPTKTMTEVRSNSGSAKRLSGTRSNPENYS